MPGGEAITRRRAAALAIEDAGDDAVGVMDGQPADDVDGFVIGSPRRRIGARQSDFQFGDIITLPAYSQKCVIFCPFYYDRYFFNQCPEQFFTVPVGRGGRRPGAPYIAAQCEKALPLGLGQGAWRLLLTP